MRDQYSVDVVTHFLSLELWYGLSSRSSFLNCVPKLISSVRVRKPAQQELFGGVSQANHSAVWVTHHWRQSHKAHHQQPVSVSQIVPPIPHHFQVPVMLIPTVQPFCLASLFSRGRVADEPMCSVEILHHKQIGLNVYTKFPCIIHIHVYRQFSIFTTSLGLTQARPNYFRHYNCMRRSCVFDGVVAVMLLSHVGRQVAMKIVWQFYSSSLC